MALIVAENDITRILIDRESMLDVFKRIEEIVVSNERGWNGQANHTYHPLRGNAAYSLLTQACPDQGISLRFFPADGTAAAPLDGTTWLLFDSADGQLLAVFGSGLLSALRTAIPSVACARVLAGQHCSSIAVIGSGRQAHAHCRILRYAFPSAEKLFVWSPKQENRNRLAHQARGWFDGQVIECMSRNEATIAAELVFLLGPPGVLQIDDDAVASDTVVVMLGNSVPASWAEHAAVFVPTMATMSDYGMAQKGDHSVADALRGDISPDGRILLKLGGLYGWDAPVIHWAYEKVLQGNMGFKIALC